MANLLKPLNIETIISDIKSGNYPQPTLTETAQGGRVTAAIARNAD
jgi:hypothetical protein